MLISSYLYQVTIWRM